MENKNESTEYLGYIIRPSTDPWAIKYNMPIEYFKIEGDGQLHGAGSIEEAREDIDARLDEFQEKLEAISYESI